ncbi:MAG: LEA type 2 family protein [Thiolinea sp.]
MFKKLIPLFLLLLTLQGCAGVPGLIERPKVSVQDVSLHSLSLTGGTVLIHINLTNPNRFPLPLHGIQYSLNLNGRQVANGAQIQNRTINPLETVAVDIPVQMNMLELFQVAPAILLNRRAAYDLSGAISLPLINVPFSRRGEIGV